MPPGADDEKKFPWGAGGEITTNLTIGSLRESMLMWLKDQRGIHAETLLLVIGALAGFAGQCAAWDKLAKRQSLDSGVAISTIGLKSGEKLYFGDLINGFLVPQGVTEYPLSGFVHAAARSVGVGDNELPDYREMFEYIASNIEKQPDFGVPRTPDNHRPMLRPRQALDIFWPRARFIMTRTDNQMALGKNVPTELWPVVTGVVTNQFLTMTKDALDPRIGVRIVMETAIAMSKVDPKKVPQIVSPPPPKQSPQQG